MASSINNQATLLPNPSSTQPARDLENGSHESLNNPLKPGYYGKPDHQGTFPEAVLPNEAPEVVMHIPPAPSYVPPEPKSKGSQDELYNQSRGFGEFISSEKEPVKWTRRRKFGLPFIWFIVLAVVIPLIFILGLALGLGVGLGRKAKTTAANSGDPQNGGSRPHSGSDSNGDSNNDTAVPFNSQYSTRMGLSFATLEGVPYLYAESEPKTIREYVISGSGKTLEFAGRGLVTTAAKANTSIAGVGITYNGAYGRHVFYYSPSNFLSNAFITNATGVTADTWTTGSIRDESQVAPAADNAALSICWDTQWFGSPDDPNGAGFRLYFGSNTKNFNGIQEMGWSIQANKWREWATWSDSSATGGVACSVYGVSDWLNVYMQSATGDLQYQWWDNSAVGSSPYPQDIHPVSQWNVGNNLKVNMKVGSPMAIVHTTTTTARNAPLGIDLVYIQLANNTIRELSIAPNAENTTLAGFRDLSDVGASGTKLAAGLVGGAPYAFYVNASGWPVYASSTGKVMPIQGLSG